MTFADTCAIGATLVVAAVSPSSRSEEERTWVDSTGKHGVKGNFVSFESLAPRD